MRRSSRATAGRPGNNAARRRDRRRPSGKGPSSRTPSAPSRSGALLGAVDKPVELAPRWVIGRRRIRLGSYVPPEDRVTIATPEGIEIELVLAGVGSRFVAGPIDAIIQIGILLALFVAVFASFGGGASCWRCFRPLLPRHVRVRRGVRSAELGSHRGRSRAAGRRR